MQAVYSSFPVDLVNPFVAKQLVGVGSATELVISLAAANRVIAHTTVQIIIVRPTTEPVVPATAKQPVSLLVTA